MAILGIIFALGALVFWGVGDFFIQRTTRKVGDLHALFFISAVGAIVLYPFVYRETGIIFSIPSNLYLLLLAGVVLFFASLFDFEAMKQGKLAIVEPVYSLELPITVGLTVVLHGEHLNWVQSIIVAVVFVGLLLTVTTHHLQLHFHKRLFERGVILAGAGAVGLALMNFLLGLSSQVTSPLLAIWFASLVVAIMSAIYLFARGDLKKIYYNLKEYPRVIFAEVFFDNLAWICFAFAVIFIPIYMATTISESYVALAVLLGVFINKEKLKRHQVLGIIFTFVGVLFLALVSNS